MIFDEDFPRRSGVVKWNLLHMSCLGKIILQSSMVVLMSRCSFFGDVAWYEFLIFVGDEVLNFFLLYSLSYIIFTELPLFAPVIMVFALNSFFLIWLTILISFPGVLDECIPLWCLCNLWRLWPIWYLMCPCSGRGGGVNAATASRARLPSQCLSLWWILYLRPFFKSS